MNFSHSGAGQITAGNGIDKDGNTLTIDNTVVTLTGTQNLTNKTITETDITVGSGKTLDN